MIENQQKQTTQRQSKATRKRNHGSNYKFSVWDLLIFGHILIKMAADPQTKKQVKAIIQEALCLKRRPGVANQTGRPLAYPTVNLVEASRHHWVYPEDCGRPVRNKEDNNFYEHLERHG